ncbi:hypothetical protein F511_21864 [Dorcoceras hygrometricum]|uniref:Uncharacterized protein n=1 Tax=Dorcoceras hygrometricum TaxID=472368 RepID=A0A2Z7B5K5_9LAMI|nr:hypothetical protein F511_21864 [Dorcoceras hygrometricum]
MEHCDVLSMQIDSDLVIYRTTLLRTFQVSTRSVLGKCVYLVTLAMSLFDLQDVCIVIGSIATLDLPMVVDLIGIYGLKGPYCTLTTTDWFLQALSVIPRGSWGDVARRFTMIRAPDLELGESKDFLPLKILTAKTVGTYVAKNKNITVDVDEPVEKKAAPKRGPGPAVAAEPTRIKFELGIEIKGVKEGDWCNASLPQIAISDKGKSPLVEKDEIKGHPAREMFFFYLADIDFLVQLRERVIEDVASFFHFQLTPLSSFRIIQRYSRQGG